MQCEDNSKLRTPLSEVCQTTDIGCVPITDGKPTCSPQPDELPFAFDPKTTTLWIFSCKSHEWIDFTKFTMCQLEALNLDNITNICDILNIGVNYSGTGECKQGTITLAELVERIKECLKLETKIITIGESDGNKIKISIDGLPNLPPVYVQGHNIWSEGGSGTETDPLIVATYDPICKWPTKTQGQVDEARVKHLGACLDGEMSRVPFPPKVCELPELSQEQVDNSNDKRMIACVDGEGVKVPFPLEPCRYPQLTSEQVQAAADKDLIVCVNGQNGKVPVPDNIFEPSVCEAPNLTLAESRAAQATLKLVACKGDGDFSQTVKIPIDGSGFFDRDYICVPSTVNYPQGAPLPGTGPLRIGCNNELYVWLCDENVWKPVKFNHSDLPYINADTVPDICNGLRMIGWYGDECVTNVQMSLRTLAELIDRCTRTFKECRFPFDQGIVRVVPIYSSGGNRTLKFKNGIRMITGNGENGTIKTYGHSFAIWAANRNIFEYGYGQLDPDTPQQEGAGEEKFTITNTTDCEAEYSIEVNTQLVFTGWHVNTYKNYGVSVISAVNDGPGYTYMQAINSPPNAFTASRVSKATKPEGSTALDGPSLGENGLRLTVGFTGRNLENITGVIPPGGSKDFYLTSYVIFSKTNEENAVMNIDAEPGDQNEPTIQPFHVSVANWKLYKRLYI